MLPVNLLPIIATCLALALPGLDFNALSEVQKSAVSQGHMVYNSGAYGLSYVNSTVGNEDFDGHRAVIYFPEEQKHFVYDLFSGNRLFSIDRGVPTASVDLVQAGKASFSIFEKQCKNKELGNAESGICLPHTCWIGESHNCTRGFYDCCTAALQDYNGRYECSNAICKDPSTFIRNYVDGGCCDA